MRKFYSLRHLQTLYGLSFLVLLLVAAVVGGVGLSTSREISAEAQRMGRLLQSIEQVRGDLYRQTKELFDYHFLADPDAVSQYRDYSLRIDASLTELAAMATSPSEKQSIGRLTAAYTDFRSFADWLMAREPAADAEAGQAEAPAGGRHLVWFDLELEGDRLSALETAFSESQNLVFSAQLALETRLARLLWIAVLLLVIPVGLAAALLLFARGFLNRAFAQPLSGVLEAMPALGEGALDRRLPEDGAAEMAALQRAINDMAAALAQSRAALVRSEKDSARGALVPVIAHNIRNPLASIRATAQLMQQSAGDPDDKAGLADIQATVDRLERWLSALLNYLNPSSPKFASVKLSDCVRHAGALLANRLAEKGLRLKLRADAEPEPIRLDPHLMEQALYGLLSNAIEASPCEGTITVNIVRGAESARIDIEDQGPGLPFSPSPSMGLNPGPSTKTFGSGLGIPFAYKVCELHGGSLGFARTDRGCTRVTIVLPARQAALAS